MKNSQAMVVFALVISAIYLVVNYYLFTKGYRLLPNNAVIKFSYSFLFIGLASLFLFNRILLFFPQAPQPAFVFQLGGGWLAAVLYFLLVILFFNIVQFLDRFWHFLPDLRVYKFYVLLSAIAFVAVVLTIGFLNATNPTVNKFAVVVGKESGVKELKIMQVSDVHFGNVIGTTEILKMLEIVQKEQPDMLLFTGDFIDEGLTPAMVNAVKPFFDRLHVPYGKIAVLGNHEYINNLAHTVPVFKQLGITLLQDSVLVIPETCIVAGRDDYSSQSFGGTKRKPTATLLADADKSLPIILLDHQPHNLNESVTNGIDLHLSGHTHHGQLFPLNLLTSSLFELSWGYRQKGKTHFYVSSGFGTWGPRIRIGNRAEVVLITMSFE